MTLDFFLASSCDCIACASSYPPMRAHATILEPVNSSFCPCHVRCTYNFLYGKQPHSDDGFGLESGQSYFLPAGASSVLSRARPTEV